MTPDSPAPAPEPAGGPDPGSEAEAAPPDAAALEAAPPEEASSARSLALSRWAIVLCKAGRLRGAAAIAVGALGVVAQQSEEPGGWLLGAVGSTPTLGGPSLDLPKLAPFDPWGMALPRLATPAPPPAPAPAASSPQAGGSSPAAQAPASG